MPSIPADPARVPSGRCNLSRRSQNPAIVQKSVKPLLKSRIKVSVSPLLDCSWRQIGAPGELSGQHPPCSAPTAWWRPVRPGPPSCPSGRSSRCTSCTLWSDPGCILGSHSYQARSLHHYQFYEHFIDTDLIKLWVLSFQATSITGYQWLLLATFLLLSLLCLK